MEYSGFKVAFPSYPREGWCMLLQAFYCYILTWVQTSLWDQCASKGWYFWTQLILLPSWRCGTIGRVCTGFSGAPELTKEVSSSGIENSGTVKPSLWFASNFPEDPGGDEQTQPKVMWCPGLRRCPVQNTGCFSQFLTDPVQILGQIFKEPWDSASTHKAAVWKHKAGTNLKV